MVVALGPGKFYGSSLPRPRFYADVMFNDQRVDPPLPVMDPLMAWAEEAHWSMGGLSFKRLRLQGRIEGNVEKLRKQKDTVRNRTPKRQKTSMASHSDQDKNEGGAVSKTPSPPPAPVAIKRRRVVGLVDEEEEVVVKRGAVRKLGDDFERVARESGMAVKKGGENGGAAAAKARSDDDGKSRQGKKRLVQGVRKIGATVVSASGIRVSPRLAKLR